MLLKVGWNISIYSRLYSSSYRCESWRLRLFPIRIFAPMLISFILSLCDPRIALLFHWWANNLLISLYVIRAEKTSRASENICLSFSTQSRFPIYCLWHLQTSLIRVSSLPSFTVASDQQLSRLIIFNVIIFALIRLLWV